MAELSLRRILGRRPAEKPASQKAPGGGEQAAPVIDMHRYALYYVSTVSDRSIRASAKIFSREFKIGITEWRILVMLNIKSPARPNDFLEFTGVDKSNVSRALSRLRKDGYILVNPDPADPRLNLVEITAAGQAVQARTSEIALSHEKIILDGFDQSEKQQLLSFLGRLLANSEKLANGG